MRSLAANRRRRKVPPADRRSSSSLYFATPSRSRTLIGDDPVPLVGAGARDDGDHGIRVAQVVDLVWYAWRDEDEIARVVLDALRQPFAVLVAHAAFEDVQHHLEPDVNVRPGNASGRYDRDVHRQLCRAHVLP